VAGTRLATSAHVCVALPLLLFQAMQWRSSLAHPSPHCTAARCSPPRLGCCRLRGAVRTLNRMKWRVEGCAMTAISRQGAATSSGLVESRSAWYDSFSGPRRL
jgi:hypothetical protein